MIALTLGDYLVWCAIGIVGLMAALVLIGGLVLLIGARALAAGEEDVS